MRSITLLLIIIGSVPVCIASPFYGILMWYWTSYFNPHRFTYGFMYDFPVAMAVAAPTLLGAIFCRKNLRSLLTVESLLLLALWAWYSITYFNAVGNPAFVGHIKEAQYEMNHISKIFLMTFVMIVIINSRKRLYWVMLVSAGSLGLLALKDALFGIRTSGEFRVWGPPDSFLTDNNAFGLAINVSLPILFLLAREEKRWWLRLSLYLCFAAGVLSVLLTYSRGGLLGLAMVLGALTLYSRHKPVAVALMIVAAVLILCFAPPSWMDRMGQFAQGNLDATANQRLVSWETSWRFAHDYPVMGGGFETLPDITIYQRYQPRALPDGLLSSGPHSIYFQLLADQGFVGLGLFLALIGCCFVTLRRVRRIGRCFDHTHYLLNYSVMLEIALLAFLTSGAFLGFIYLDLIYQIIGTIVVLKALLRIELQSHALQQEPERSRQIELAELQAAT
jgi:probable O-glycosylation ligase (exosortase A-associated)